MSKCDTVLVIEPAKDRRRKKGDDHAAVAVEDQPAVKKKRMSRLRRLFRSRTGGTPESARQGKRAQGQVSKEKKTSRVSPKSKPFTTRNRGRQSARWENRRHQVFGCRHQQRGVLVGNNIAPCGLTSTIPRREWL